MRLAPFVVVALVPLAVPARAETKAAPAAPAAPAVQAPSGPARFPEPVEKLEHVVVIYLENHSFDSLFGEMPGVDGFGSPVAHANRQVDAKGVVYQKLPQVASSKLGPKTYPNGPFPL